MPDEPVHLKDLQQEAQPSALQVAEHVLGVGVGAASGMAVGAVLGVVGGLPGVAVGAVGGAVVGGLGGEALAELIDVAFDDRSWREHCERHNYSAEDYEQYRSAYQLGCLARFRFGEQPFEEIEAQLRSEWDAQQASARLSWHEVRDAACDAWKQAAVSMKPQPQVKRSGGP